jgi:CRP-like cAMP-binding protein
VLLTLEKVLFLKSVGIFSQIPEEALVEVATAIEEIEIRQGESIFKQGDVGTSMYIVVEGKVRVRNLEQMIGDFGEREVFGELAALDPVPRSATVTALEDCYLFRMEQSVLYDLMTQHVEVARGIIRTLCTRIRDCDARIKVLSSGGRLEPPGKG